MNSRVVVTKDRRNHWLDMKNNRRGHTREKTREKNDWEERKVGKGKLFRDSFLWDFEEIEPKRNGVCSYRNIYIYTHIFLLFLHNISLHPQYLI